MANVTDRQQLETKIKATVEWNFGTICDAINGAVQTGEIPAELGSSLKRIVRKNGNDIHRVIVNHLDFYNIVRNHRADQINIPRVTNTAIRLSESTEEGK